ncbi:DEAD/DEAH box RNA helicase [Thraustotheca clavata]|uniref:DEAD/DEAH box RNA helicase n=1 Tax=Thraustotheca clavata TaxID=74557 RepID=A0A1V9Z1G1_9STRA|nr:DEAD/DEAH box RNA helicase [Thraustotheca clavata]
MEPLRKRLKHQATRDECNFVSSYALTNAATVNEEEANWLRLELGVTVDGGAPPPCKEFKAMGLPESLVNAIAHEHPTSVQMQAIPSILQGRDVLAIAPPGSGKTLAFLVPLIALLYASPTPGILTGLVLVPTRELMEQVYRVCTSLLGDHSGNGLVYSSGSFGVAGICGGMPFGPQLDAVQRGVDIIVATPGRLLHLVQDHNLSLNALRYLVLDEVDQMVAFESTLSSILRHCNPLARQTIVCSATVPIEVQRIVNSALLNPITITTSSQRSTRNSNQTVYECVVLQKESKLQWLLRTLRSIQHPPVLVFCNMSTTVWRIVRNLASEQFHVAPLVGEMDQRHRFQVLNALRTDQVDVVVATDIAARGLDFPQLKAVVMHDCPESISMFIHRAGRLGRQSQKLSGSCHLCLSFDDKKSIVAGIGEYIESQGQEIPIEMTALSRFRAG